MKKTILISFVLILVGGLFMQAHASLQTLGTDSLGNRLIYDSDLDLTWYDYTNSATSWFNQTAWAEALTVSFGGTIYDDWRLPVNFDQSCGGPNCTNSEMGNLFYTKLGNPGGWAAPFSTGDFQHLIEDEYWSGSQYERTGYSNYRWYFRFSNGDQGTSGVNSSYSAIAVRGGMAVAPEPISSTLFIIGGATMGFRRFRKK